MLTWVMYDVVRDRVRNKVMKTCEKSGIYRVQYSVWLGNLNKTQCRELRTRIEDLINPEEDRVYIFPMCKEDFNSCILLGQAFDRDLITDDLKALFL